MFKSGYSLNLYQIIEDDFMEFLKNISIDYYQGNERKKIFSPKLGELLIRIGSQIDIFFRNWDIVQSHNPGVSIEDLKFGNYKAIEKDINLNDKKIKIIATDETLIPFNDWIKNDPSWLTSYNHVKHNGFVYKEEGNLNNVIESLSALFLLNCLHGDLKIKLIEYGYRKVDLDTYNLIVREKSYLEAAYPYITSQLFEFEKEIDFSLLTFRQYHSIGSIPRPRF